VVDAGDVVGHGENGLDDHAGLGFGETGIAAAEELHPLGDVLVLETADGVALLAGQVDDFGDQRCPCRKLHPGK
jgi:hypothetical protein